MSGAHALTTEVYLASVCSNLSDKDVLRIVAVCSNVRTTLHFAGLLSTKEPALLLHGIAGTSGLWRHLSYRMVAEFLRDTRQLCVSTSSTPNVVLGEEQEALRLKHGVCEMRWKQPDPPMDSIVIEFKFDDDRAQAFFKGTGDSFPGRVESSNTVTTGNVSLNLALYKNDDYDMFLYLRVLPVLTLFESCKVHYIALLKCLEGMGTESEVYLRDWIDASLTNGGWCFHEVKKGSWLRERLYQNTALCCIVAVWRVQGECRVDEYGVLQVD